LIYLDHHATTPVAPEVREATLPYLQQHFGNPSSVHEYGAVAAGLRAARHRVHSERE
jgi:cysteine desulfurase